MPKTAGQTANIFATPMMKQYMDIKSRYKDCILFFRLGDFYEMFMEDAKIGASVLDITLTSRDRGKDGKIPMAGVPFHAVEPYLSKLVRSGYKVAICEQLSDPSNPGLVERDVVRVVTPGTLLDESTLSKKENNFIFALHIKDDTVGLSIADLSTGFFAVSELKTDTFNRVIVDYLAKYNPSEFILSPTLYNDASLLHTIRNNKHVNIFPYFDWQDQVKDAHKILIGHFKIKSLEIFGIHQLYTAQKAAAALLGYLTFTQKGELTHIKSISHIEDSEHMLLDRSTIYNLELFQTLRENRKKGTLVDLIDRTVTPMGGRMLRQWLMAPLINKGAINDRYDAVQRLLNNNDANLEIRAELAEIMDIERIISRLALGVGNPKDLINLQHTLDTAGAVKEILKDLPETLFTDISKDISKDALDLTNVISFYIEEDPPFDPKSGGFIKNDVSNELDDLRKSIKNSKEYISGLELRERSRTGINSLKVRYNQVFGYYIEVTKSNLHHIPPDYQRKQTMVNAERYTTDELKVHEEKILTAEEHIKDMEYALFRELVQKIMDRVVSIQQTAKALAILDCISGFADLANTEDYIRPELSDEDEINIKQGRHPVVADFVGEGNFVPNDVKLDKSRNQLLIITGPNMAGKSVFIRQVAVMVIMAQIGCFIPAKEAKLSITDKVFVRSGASDFIAGGLSTFMVEMMETASILHNCTDSSLIIMDEIGRGTSTYDGISIAWSVAEYLVSNGTGHPKTLFATHYHELQDLQYKFPDSISNYQVLVDESKDGPVFLHKVSPGAADRSYGIEVARLAGVPDQVYKNAMKMMAILSSRNSVPMDATIVTDETLPVLVKKNELEMFSEKLSNLDISITTPLEALNILAELKQIWERNNIWEK